MHASDTFDEEQVPAIAGTTESDVDGDHPDPVTLSEPAYDAQGLLRWASLPAPPAPA